MSANGIRNRDVEKKACFINPPDIRGGYFPYGFSQIISIAKEKRFQVKLIDLNGQSSSDELSTFSENGTL